MFGVGAFYNDLETGRVLPALGFKDDYAGVEAFYNFAITPAARFSVNMQMLPSVVPDIDDSFLVTGRLQLVF